MTRSYDALTVLRQFVDGHETKIQAAKALGISPGYLGDMYHERRAVGDDILDQLGYKRVTRIVKKDE